jgi:hypothetical protein
MDAMPPGADRDHTHEELSWEEVVEALAALERVRVAVRVVEPGDPERLVAVFRGHLGAPTNKGQQTVFSPLRVTGEEEPGDLEDTGVYLRRDRFHKSIASPGRTVVHIVQGSVIVNVRRL